MKFLAAGKRKKETLKLTCALFFIFAQIGWGADLDLAYNQSSSDDLLSYGARNRLSSEGKSLAQARRQTAYEEKLREDFTRQEILRNRQNPLDSSVKRLGQKANTSSSTSGETASIALKQATLMNQYNLAKTHASLEKASQTEMARISAAGLFYVHEKTQKVDGRDVVPTTYYFMGAPVARVGFPDQTKRMESPLLLDFQVGMQGTNPYLKDLEGSLQKDIDRVAKEAGIKTFQAGFMDYFIEDVVANETPTPQTVKEYVLHEYRTAELRDLLDQEVPQSQGEDVKTLTHFQAHGLYEGTECPECLANHYSSYFEEVTEPSGKIAREEVSNIQYFTEGEFKGQVKEQERLSQDNLAPGILTQVTESFLYESRPVTKTGTDSDEEGTLGDGKDILISEIRRSGVRDFDAGYVDDFDLGRLPESFQGKSSERFTERAFDMEYDDSETLTKYTFDRTPHGVRDIFEFNASRPGDIDILGRYVHFDENHTLTTQDGGLMKYTQDRTLQYDILDRVQSFQETTCVEGFPGCSQTNFTANRFDLDRPWVLMDFTEKVQYKEVQDDGSIITLIETIIRTTQEMDFDFNIPLKFTDVIVKEEPGKTTTQTVVTTQTLDVHGLLVHFEEVTDEIVETSSTKTHQKISVIQDITNDIQQRRPLGWTLEETTTPFNITTGDVTGTTVRTLDHTVTDLEDLLPNKYAQMIHEFDRSVGIHALSFLTGDAFGLAGVLNSNARTLGLELELKPFENVTGIHYTSQGNTPISQASLPDSFKREALPTISSSLREDVTRYEETVPFGKDIFRRPLEEYHAVQFPERAIYEYREFYYDILSHLRVVILGMHEERRLGELEGVPLQRPIQAKKGKRAKIEPAFIPLPSRVFDRFEVGGESIKAFFFDLWMESNLYWKVLQHESYGTQMRTQLISRQPSYTLFEGILPLKGKVSKIIGEEKWVIQTKVPLPFSQAWKIYRNSFGGVEKILRSFSIQIFARENILSAEKFHRGMIPSGLNDLKNQLSRQMSILSKPASREPTLEEYTERAVAVQKWVRTFQKLKSLYPEVDVNMLKDKARQEVPRFEEKTFQKLSDLAQRIPGNQLTLKDVHPIILSQEPKFLPMEDLMNQGLLNSNAPVQVAPSREPMEHPADASGSSGQGGAK